MINSRISERTAQILSDYKNYWNKNLSGMHGKTAQFWIKYVEMIHLYIMTLAEVFAPMHTQRYMKSSKKEY